MYHVIGTGLTALILYLLSYFFYQTNIYSKQLHRKFWNLVLATAFIVTALAGVFLALQINYKWNIPAIKSILKWHAEFGLGLSITGIFHLLWHLSYYRDIFKEDKTVPSGFSGFIQGSSDLPVNLFVVGFISSSVQLLLLKEIMNISGGYELMAGIFLGSWLIGSAAGSALARTSKLSDIRKINLLFSLSPLISLLMMLLLARLYLKTGETPSFLAGFIYCFLVLTPFCLLSGFTFVKLIQASKDSADFVPGKSFSLETTGGIAAGILVSLVGSGHLNIYRTFFLVVILAVAYVLLTFIIVRKEIKLVIKILILVLSIIVIGFSPDILLRQLLLRGVKVVDTKDTQYGNITLAEYGGDISTYYNQRLLAYADDAVESEEDIHYAMLQAQKPENVLLVSGSIRSHLNEIVKYPVKKIIYVERDPALTSPYTNEEFGLSELVIENEDAFSYLKNTEDKFDVVIMLLPPPSSLMLNRYFTYEFFRMVKGSLNSDGVFSCSPGINPNYFNKESVNLYSSIYNALKSVFMHVTPVSGSKLYFLASDMEISSAMCQLVSERNIRNVYVGPDYLSDDLIKVKSEEITALMNPDIRMNRAAIPVACFYYQSYNLSKNLSQKIPALILMTILFLLPVISVRRPDLVMYFSASALAGFEIILLLILQLTAGNMYQLTGLIIAGIMAGLAAGSGSEIHLFNRKYRNGRIILLIIFYLVSAIAVDPILKLGSGAGSVILLLLSGFVPAFLTGSIFRELTINKDTINEISPVYSADLAGSAIGFTLCSGFIIPFLGIKISMFILPVLIFTGFILSVVKSKH